MHGGEHPSQCTCFWANWHYHQPTIISSPDLSFNSPFSTLSRSSRAIPKPNFRALESGDDDFDANDWSTDGEGDGDAPPGRKRKAKGSGKGHSSAATRQKQTAALDELEKTAKDEEDAVAELLPQAQAWKQRYAALVAENEALQQKVLELTQELARRGGAVGEQLADMHAPGLGQLDPAPV